jgi:monofunctional biosynthetic peptidoglycan transglycosylase
MPRAAIAAEDARFCTHHGFDLTAIEQAFARNQKGGRIRGGSTISQQTAKNVFLFQGGGYLRKGLEAYFTVLIENIWGKRRIMEVYLNVAETGIGTYGVNAGSMRYFKHDASQMSPRERPPRSPRCCRFPRSAPASIRAASPGRYGNAITARIGTVRGDGLDSCIR